MIFNVYIISLQYIILTDVIIVGCTIVEALEAATLHPARTLGIDSYKGVLNFGTDADFVLLNEKLELLSTWISGECVYEMNIGSVKQFNT